MPMRALILALVAFCGVAAAQAPLTILDSPLPPLQSGADFHVTLHATGGVPPYRWDVGDGILPEGITLSHEGVLSGRPAKSGSFTITIRVIDSGHPAHLAERNLTAEVSSALLLDWLEPPAVHDNRIDGSVKVSNGSRDPFDLTIIIVAVATDTHKATAIGYEHFELKPQTIDFSISFGTTLPRGGYAVHADAIAEIPARNSILRQRLQTAQPLQVAVGP